MIKRILHIVFLAFFLIQAAVGGQGSEVTRILGEIRSALGGDSTLASVKTLAIEGQTTRVTPNGDSVAQDFEIAIDLDPKAPKYLKRDVVANLGGNEISRRSGFNGNELIYEVDTPPAMSGGVRFTPMSGLGPNATPEQIAEQSKQRLLTAKREFTRLAIAVLGHATTAYPVEFKYIGLVDATNGKANALEITSTDGFKATLYVDGKSHLPVMLTWMEKEPVRLTMSAGMGGGGNSMSVGGGTTVITGSADVSRTPEELAQMQADMQRRIKEAEANRRLVEFRVVYGEYKTINGVRVPTRLQHTVDGNPTEQITLQKVSLNAKVDGKFRR